MELHPGGIRRAKQQGRSKKGSFRIQGGVVDFFILTREVLGSGWQ